MHAPPPNKRVCRCGGNHYRAADGSCPFGYAPDQRAECDPPVLSCTCAEVYPFGEEQGCSVHPNKPPFPPSTHPTFFPGDRKAYPVFTGLLMYFPDACAAVANCSHVANEQHNPGEPVHWDRSKSIGEGNEVLRHLMDGTRSPVDNDKVLHYAKAAWRMFELLQRQIEAMRGK